MRKALLIALLAAGPSLTACGDSDGGTTPPATDDFCHGEADGTPCDDANPCTVDDVCGLGVCLGRAGNDGDDCDDGCVTGGVCRAGACAGAPVDCSGFDDACATGTCEPGVGCVATPIADGAPCDDGDACTLDDACSQGACTAEPIDCGAAAPCMTRACDPASGQCVSAPVADGSSCDDADACTLGDMCAAGACAGEPRDCAQLNDGCTMGVCQPETGDCVTTTVAAGAACDDGDPCTVGETCVGDSCGGATLAPSGTACSDGDPCTTGETCSGGACLGAPTACPAGDDPCLAAFCDPVTGCGTQPVDDGTACDDGNTCTVGETCQQGACGAGTNTCQCDGQADGTGCDDGSACTTGDSCQGGACLGTITSCAQLDGACVEGACDPTTGGCVAVARPLGTACSDGQACTVDDHCVLGECVPGAVTDCSDLDGACVVGRCDSGTGGCVAVDVPDGHQCDDGDFCTSHDACVAGDCVGSVDACAACAGLDTGAACDDGSACSTSDVCVAGSGLLACHGARVDCSAQDGACTRGVCDLADGQCDALPLPDLHPCDDGDACTVGGACSSGTCQATPVVQCGASVAQCEPELTNDLVSEATPVTLTGGQATVLAAVLPAGEPDWFAVTLQQGDHVTLRTSPTPDTSGVCSTSLDTQLALWTPDGSAFLAHNDDGDSPPWSRIDGVTIPETGTWFIGVSGYVASGPGRYLLEIGVSAPPTCSGVADCPCGDYTCAEGACVPADPVEIEPNDGPGAASDVAVGVRRAARIDVPDDEDWFRVELFDGGAIDVETHAFCDDVVDVHIAIWDATGATELAFDSDDGVAGHALISHFVPPAPGAYLIRVDADDHLLGGYVLEVRDSSCVSDADCGCIDQRCEGGEVDPELGGGAGVCVPVLSAPEQADAYPLILGDRVHVAIDQSLDSDWFVVSLAPGTYAVETLPYCASELDSTLRLYAPDGTTLLAQDDNSGQGHYAAVMSWTVTTAGDYRIRVAAHGSGSGQAILRVTQQ